MDKPAKTIGLYNPLFEKDSCGVGFVVNIKGKKSHDIVKKGLNALKCLSHRGAVGADPKTGDGAGILLQIPHEFYVKACLEYNIQLPDAGDYGTGLIFLPTDTKERQYCKEVFAEFAKQEGQMVAGWRSVPIDDAEIGLTAKKTQPVIEQIFISRGKNTVDILEFKRKLYIIRKQIENKIRLSNLAQKSFFYITNISSETVIYKGLLMPHQVEKFFLDLGDPLFKSAIALVHSRYSTNTFPTWDLSQPFRFLAHNGEINTLRGNINWMAAREGLLKSALLGDDIGKIKPVIVPGGSDSAALDNMLELLVLAGRSLPHAMMMLIPQAWEHDSSMPKKTMDFYRFHACFMEPWDGPAAVAFTDGRAVGAVLDRNGLRPARYIVTNEDEVVMASEVGVLDIEPQSIVSSGRLEPGKMFYIDTEKGSIINDDEIKESVSGRSDYGAWLDKNTVELDKLPKAERLPEIYPDLNASLKAFGYTREDLKMIIAPMAEEGKEPIGSMGNDTPHAVLSKKPQLLYNYFRQLFAQVTNPPIDPIREEIVMSMESFVGSQKNILEETPEHCSKLTVKDPILTNEELEKIRMLGREALKAKTIPIIFHPDKENDFLHTLKDICGETEKAINDGFNILILSDRGVNRANGALPALLAMGAVHHHLIKKALRTRAGIIIESGEPREVQHFALLFAYGADAVNPYLAYEAIGSLVIEKDIVPDQAGAIHNYRSAVYHGILKIISKMGISTLHSYRGAQIFEALGLDKDVIDMCFSGTVSRIGGAGLAEVEKETIMRHEEAFNGVSGAKYLSGGGVYQWKRDGEFHLWNPDSIAALQDCVRTEDFNKYKEFASLINDQSKNPTTLRSLFNFKNGKAIPIDEVEPAENIFKRFATGAMSFGSISQGAHETVAIAMNRIGARSNTGEGGEDPERFIPLPNGDSKRSAVKQVASGRFGVTANYLVNADEIQIKMAQGAKPGEGGQLPGHKVSSIIARMRYTTPGVTLISPPPHHDIYSIEDLAQLIFDLKNVNPRARISVKLVSEIGVGTIAAGVAKGHADMILISGGDGGTGASPLSSIRYAGLPWELGLSETHQTLVLNNLRSRVRLQTDGQMRTGRDIAIAALLGAEEFGFCTSVLIASGCVMLRHCHLNNCSVGVATQDDALSKRYAGKPEYIITYFKFVARELREIMAGLGVRSLEEMVGRVDLLDVNKKIFPWKAKNMDLSAILYKPEGERHCSTSQDHGIENVLDRKLIKLAKASLDSASPTREELDIRNDNRTTGAMLSGEVCRRWGEEGLADGTIHFKFRGFAGQSFGAFLAKGVTFELEGLANDYVGKGISGGKIIIYPNGKSAYKPEENIIIGNTTFYGAINGEAYIRGVAGERFCIRNSGLSAVVEGVGDHACEYMTGGCVVVLGCTGRNFAAGMSGGIAYVYDKNADFKHRCNSKMVELGDINEEDSKLLQQLLSNHYKGTKSPLAKKITDDFAKEKIKFVKVTPLEYKRVLSKKVEVSDG